MIVRNENHSKMGEEVISNLLTIIRPYGHKTFQYDFYAHTLNLSNQKRLFIWYSVLVQAVGISESTKLC